MRSLLIAVVLCLPLAAQTPDASRTFPKGLVSASLTVNLSATPEAGDNINISCSTSGLRVTLITPDGRRVTSETALAARLGWFESPSSDPDWGRSVIITFHRVAQSGAYAVEVAGQTTRKSTVSVFLSSPSKAHAAVIEKAFPGATVSASVTAPATVSLPVKEDQKASIIDILVTDPATRIALTLPDGRTITPESVQDGITCEPPIPEVQKVARLLFPQPGRHYVFHFRRAAHGVYTVSAIGAGEPAEFRALFVPYEQGWDKYLAEFSPPQGLSSRHLPVTRAVLLRRLDVRNAFRRK
jgi:hypothetical protein